MTRMAAAAAVEASEGVIKYEGFSFFLPPEVWRDVRDSPNLRGPEKAQKKRPSQSIYIMLHTHTHNAYTANTAPSPSHLPLIYFDMALS